MAPSKPGSAPADNHLVEGVLIPTDERKTACVSLPDWLFPELQILRYRLYGP